jgi:hypothetical protein
LILEQLEDRTVLNGHTLATATPLLFDAQGLAEATGSLPSTDFFAFSLPEAGHLISRVHAQGEFTRLSLLGPGGQLLMQSDGQSAANPDDLIDQHLDPGITYCLEVQGLSNGPGSYDLKVAFAATNVPFQPIPVGRHPQALVTGDFTGDGHTDLATLISGPYFNAPDGSFGQAGRVTVLLNSGDGTFGTQTIQVGTNVLALVAADFNGDGRTDLAVLSMGATIYDPSTGIFSSSGSSVSVLLSNGDGTFQIQAYPVGLNPVGLVTGDFNGDGHTDLAVANSDSISVLLNNGDGTFRTETPIPVGPGPTALVTGDFNGDGRTDLAVASFGNESYDQSTGNFTYSGNKVSVLLSNGDGTFQTQVYPVGPDPEALVTGDFNGDGHTDLAVEDSAYNNYGSGDVTVLLGQGDGTFKVQAPVQVPNPIALVTGDFNGDGHTDLAVIDAYLGAVTVLLGQGDGSFQTQTPVQVGVDPNLLVAGDFNGDGRTDLVVSDLSFVIKDVTVLLAQGDGTFQTEAIPVGPDPHAIVTGDFTGDGRTDLAVAAGGFSNYNVTVLLVQGDGTFRTDTTIPLTGQDHVGGLLAADFTGSGRTDLAYGSLSPAGVTVLLAQGDGTFQTKTTPVANSPGALVAGDFNGDGRTDLAFVDYYSSTNDVTVLLGQGDGTFQTETVSLPPGQYPSALVAGDFTGDGRTDLAVTYYPTWIQLPDGTWAPLGAPGGVTLLLGQPDGTFRTESISLPLGWSPTALVAGDFTGNGRTDLATVNGLPLTAPDGSFLGFAGSVTVLLGQPDGTFQTETITVGQNPVGVLSRLDFGLNPVGLVAADFTGNGRTDLAVAVDGTLSQDQSTYVGSNVTVLLGQPDGTFQTETIPVGPGPTALVAGDFNGDGHTDLALTDDFHNGVRPDGSYGNLSDLTVLLGHGDGTFQTETIPLRQSPDSLENSLVAGDFNGDGRTDLAVAGDIAFNAVTVLLGQPDGTFQTETVPVAEPGGYGLAVGDFNGDGRIDLAVNASYANDLTLYLGKGDGSFIAPSKFKNPARSSPVVGDVNGDGVPDVLTLNAAGEILYRAGRPAALGGGFEAPIVVNPTEEDPAARDVALLQTRHGVLVAALEAQASAVTFYALTSAGGFTRVGELALAGTLPVRLLAGDLNGDGLGDLVVADAGSQTVNIYLQSADSAATFTAPLFGPAPNYQVPVGQDPTDLALADIGGDGRPDILVADQYSGDVSVLRNDPAAPFASVERFRAGTGRIWPDDSSDSLAIQSDTNPVGLAPVRIGKGSPPSLVVTDQIDNSFSVLRNSAVGGFFNPDSSPAYKTGGHPSVVVSADFNGDGLPDLAILNDQDGTISIFLGTASGGFTPAGTYSAGNQATGLSVADVTGDGIPDLLVGNKYGDVLILQGNGDGTFQSYRRLNRSVTLAVADLRGTGEQDIIFADQSLDRVAVQYAQPGQTFTQTRQDGILAPGAVKVADLNGDGIPDLIVANSGGNDVLVYPGLGNGQFGPAQSFFTGTNPVSVTVAYLNDDMVKDPTTGQMIDPTPDLIVANQGSNDVTILYGQGQGANWTLKPGPRLDAHGLGPVSTAVRYVPDPNGGPGIPQLLVADSQSNHVTLIPGVGGGFFNDQANAVQTFSTGIDPQQVLVGDFQRQGQLDMLTVNAGSNDLTFFSDFGAGQSISSGGDHPLSAVEGDFNHDGLMDLAVANNGDGRVSLLLGDANGLALASTFGVDGMLHPTSLALGLDGRTIYIAGESGEFATPVDLSLHLPHAGVDSEGQFALRLGTGLPTLDAVERQREASLVPLSERALALVGTILTGVEAVPENSAASGGEDLSPREEPPDGPPIQYWWKTRPPVPPEVADLLFGLDSAAEIAGAALSEGSLRATSETAEPPRPPTVVPQRAAEAVKPEAAPVGPAGAAPAPAKPGQAISDSVGAVQEPEAATWPWPALAIAALLAPTAAFLGLSRHRRLADRPTISPKRPDR